MAFCLSNPDVLTQGGVEDSEKGSLVLHALPFGGTQA